MDTYSKNTNRKDFTLTLRQIFPQHYSNKKLSGLTDERESSKGSNPDVTRNSRILQVYVGLLETVNLKLLQQM